MLKRDFVFLKCHCERSEAISDFIGVELEIASPACGGLAMTDKGDGGGYERFSSLAARGLKLAAPRPQSLSVEGVAAN
jgi:hypothetical protein